MACCIVFAALIAAMFSLVGWLTGKPPARLRPDAAGWRLEEPVGEKVER
jgi:hypothetical protein